MSSGGPGGGGNSDLEAILEVVYLYYGGDRDKVKTWLRTPHPELGDNQPIMYLESGRYEEVLAVAQNMLEQMGHGPQR